MRHNRCATAVLIAIAAIFLLSSSPVKAEAPAFYALLVGNSDYNANGKIDPPESVPDNVMPDLDHPCPDVHKVERALQQYVVKNLEVLCDLPREALLKKFNAFAGQLATAPPRSTIFVYYAGHGIQYDGKIYAVPTLYDPSKARGLTDYSAQQKFLRESGGYWLSLLRALPKRPDIAVVVIIDACRSSPFKEDSKYNEDVIPEGEANQFVYWATNGGNTSQDSGLMSQIIAHQFQVGGDAMTIAQGIWYADHLAFTNGKKDYKGEPFTGGDFKWEAKAALAKTTTTTTATASNLPEVATARSVSGLKVPVIIPRGPDGKRHAPTLKTIKIANNGMKLDIFACEGPTAQRNLDLAYAMATQIQVQAKALQLGEIRVRYLPDAINSEPGYRVRTNLMRYDVRMKKYSESENKIVAPEERAIFSVADAFPDAHLLPQPGIGVGGHPTVYYLSAFLCAR